MADPQVLAVIAAHASGTWLEDTLRAVASQTYKQLKVVVVRVGEVAVPDVLDARKVHATVDVPPDAGFVHAVRAGIEAGGDEPYVLLLHDDVAPAPDVVQRLVERAEADPSVACVGAKLVDWDNPEVLQEVGGAIDRFAGRRSGLEVDEIDHGQHDSTDDVLFCSAACLLVRRTDLEQAGGLDPDAWPLYEDVDLCWRLRRRGRRVVVAPDARVRHAQALSRGMRRAAGRGYGAIGMLMHTERGRLWFMVKNYAPISLILLLPQFVVFEALRVVGGLVRREFWRLRTVVNAWGRVAGELTHVIDRRRHAGPREVEDQELLRLGARQAATERRYERVAWAERAWQALQRGVSWLGVRARDPVTWAAVVAVVALLVMVRDVIFAGRFFVGEIRPPVAFGDALLGYVSRTRTDGFDLYAPGTPGIVLLGAVRSLAFGSAALAEKLLLLVPLFAAGIGAARLGRTIGLGDRGRRLLAVLAIVNPVTLVLVRGGFLGATVMWAIAMWVGAVMFDPPARHARALQRGRRLARWGLAWLVATMLHPPALVWFAGLTVAVLAARRGDGRDAQRRRLVVVGIATAILGSLPWSLSWFGWPTPLVGRLTSYIVRDAGLDAATFGAGWPLLVWVGVALVAAYATGATRTAVALSGLLAASWLAGVAGGLPRPTALAGVGWCTLVILAFITRRVGDEVSTYALGWRQAVVISTVVAVAVGWGGAVVQSTFAGTDGRAVALLPSGRDEVGRVLWLQQVGQGTFAWATDGFDDEIRSFPVPSDEGMRLVNDALGAARTNRTHRLGALLALADVSHVIALDAQAGRGLDGQADLAPEERLSGTTVFRNDAWGGRALLLDAQPTDVLGPQGLADLVSRLEPVEVTRGADGGDLGLTVPEDAEGVVYLAVGAGAGWTIGGAEADAGAAGVWVDAAEVAGTTTAEAPPGVWRVLLPLQALIVLALLGVWLAGSYLSTPEQARPAVPPDLRFSDLPRFAGVLPLAAIALAGWIGWANPVAADAPFLSSAWYCPPVDRGYTQTIAIANPTSGRADYLVRPSLVAPPTAGGSLDSMQRDTVEVDSTEGAVVETYGRRIAVAATVSRDGAADSSLCAESFHRTTYFAEGGRAATKARPRLFEAYVLHNPFPDLARASVRFISPDEVIAPPRLRDVRIEPGSHVVVDPEDQFEPMLDLSVEITVWQGRAIPARRLCIGIGCVEAGTAVEEVSWSLGVEPRTEGVFPRAGTANAETAVIVVNPGQEPARVSLFFVTEEGSLPRATFDVDPVSRTTFEVGEVAPDLSSLHVTLSADRPVAVETLVTPDNRRDVSLLPLLSPARRWAIPAAESRTVLVVNPGTRPVRVTLDRMGPGEDLQPLLLDPNRVQYLTLPGEDPFGLLVTSSGGPVTAAVVGRPGALPGIPLD